MSLEKILKRVDELIAARDNEKRGDRRTQQRRTQDVPVAEDRREAERRATKDRRGTPRPEDFSSNEAYNKAYDRWAENQR